MSDRPIATVSGTMLVPGVSRNSRLYTKEVIAKAVGRMQTRIADPAGLPIVMRTHHEAGDNSAKIVGRLTEASLGEDGSGRYTALIYDTEAGRDIAALVTPKKPALRTVSIHGFWLGPLKKLTYNGESVTTADDLEIGAVDWTATPGVVGATVHDASWLNVLPAESASLERVYISESVEATVSAITEAVEGDDESAWVAFVEAAYTQKQKDQLVGSGAMRNAQGKGSYPIKSKSDLRKAIQAVGRGGANHNAIRRHIIARARALGLSSMIPDNWSADGSMKESTTRFGEIREYMGGDYSDSSQNAGICIDAYNGPVCITLRAGSVSPSDLRAVAAAAMTAACDALRALDPDMDADIDIAGSGESTTAVVLDSEHIVTAASIEAYNRLATPGASGAITTITVPVTANTITAEELRGVVHKTVERAAGRQHELDAPAETLAGYRERIGEAAPDTTTDISVNCAETTSPHEEVPAVSEATSTTEAAATTAPTRNLTDADITALGAVFAAALKEHAASPTAAPAVETQATTSQATAEQATTASSENTKEPAVTEKALLEKAVQIETDLKTKLDAEYATRETVLREALVAQMREELLRVGTPTRKGFRVHENEQQQPDVASLWEGRADTLLGDWAKTPVPQPGTGVAPAATVTQPEVPRTAASAQ